MDLNIPKQGLNVIPSANFLYDYLEENADKLKLSDASVFFQFPIYKELDGDIVRASFLLISKYHGIIAFGLTSDDGRNGICECQKQDNQLEVLINSIFCRVLRNKALRKNSTTLKFPLLSCLFAPSLVDHNAESYREGIDSTLIQNCSLLEKHLTSNVITKIDDTLFQEIIATIDGSKGLIKPKIRNVSQDDCDSKGAKVQRLETEIAVFDMKQRHGYNIPIQGPQRIRGLAGSGKTVILAMKAAQTHLQHPDAKILFTFSTKSLYQHVKRMITRFYRQFDDKDPNWNNLQILHAWGGRTVPGVYYNACCSHGVQPLSLTAAKSKASQEGKRAFDYVCENFTEQCDIKEIFDFAFIDEGQDFSSTFINLCRLLTKEEKIVWAYDELQNIFDISTPNSEEVFGRDSFGNPNSVIKDDIILRKCYRNPREIIIISHAIGFGLYGSRIVQMLEDKEHWGYLGYEITSGDCTPKSKMTITRPEGNSPSSISNTCSIDDIIKFKTFDIPANEVKWVCKEIQRDIKEGLLPDDILIICVDDRNFKLYSTEITEILEAKDIGIMCKNTQSDPYGVSQFQQSGHVTISTVHKAKGNESYSVYIVGVDALFQYPGIISRNKLFTAMTRAKAWIRISGIGLESDACNTELQEAIDNFPELKFSYPNAAQIKIMQRDLAGSALRDQQTEQMLDQVMTKMSPGEITKYISARRKAGKKEF